MNIEYRIYGTHARDDIISTIQGSLPSPVSVYYDERPYIPDMKYACYETCKKAFGADHRTETTHICALQDDVKLCDNFTDIISSIVLSHPDDIICLFPFDHLVENKVANSMLENDTPYINVNINTGQGIIMPVQYVKECFDYLDSRFHGKIEEALGIKLYARSHGRNLITTIPSTIQHIGDDSTLFPNANPRRTRYFMQNPNVNWECETVLPAPNWYIKYIKWR